MAIPRRYCHNIKLSQLSSCDPTNDQYTCTSSKLEDWIARCIMDSPLGLTVRASAPIASSQLHVSLKRQSYAKLAVSLISGQCDSKCTCSNRWIQCFNSGLTSSAWAQCWCPVGFSGTSCQCLSLKGFSDLNGYSPTLAAFEEAQRKGFSLAPRHKTHSTDSFPPIHQPQLLNTNLNPSPTTTTTMIWYLCLSGCSRPSFFASFLPSSDQIRWDKHCVPYYFYQLGLGEHYRPLFFLCHHFLDHI